jgi:YebC/PmpR family DNA-binding regulatory protein
MSGHSKWENIKRQKGAQDRARAKVFSKLSSLITAAVKEGGSPDPDKNVQLRQAVDRAKDEDMPKENIKRAIDNALKKQEASNEVVLEGYGPYGLAVLIKAVTDNRQRTIQEVKNIFDKHGGSLAEPGSVSYKFSRQGRVVVKRRNEETILNLIDYGVEDFIEKESQVIVLIKPEKLKKFVDQIENKFNIISHGVRLVANDILTVDSGQREKIDEFLEMIRDHPDVEEVFVNV